MEILDAVPTITISVENDFLGIIQSASHSMSALLGYSKSELVNLKVNELMPPIFGHRHDEFLEMYLERGDFGWLKQERVVLARSKVGYLIPISLSATSQESLLNG